MDTEQLNILSKRIIGAAIEVHRTLGPGLLEHTYQEALLTELRLRGIRAEKEVPLPCVYKGLKLDCGFRADILVEDSIILELKATETEIPLHLKQLTTYLRVADKRLGLLINFNREILCEGIKRAVNKF